MTAKTRKIVKRIAYTFLALLIVLIIGGLIGIKKFDDYLFKEKTSNLKFTAENKPIPFDWATKSTDNHFEPHVAIIIPVEIEGLKHKFYFQFDTGSPYSYIYENDLKSLKKIGLKLNEIEKEEGFFIKKFDFNLSDNLVESSMLKVYKKYGNTFGKNDTIKPIKIGTIGSDFLENKITAIDFKNKTIQFFNERPKWMKEQNFKSFSYKGRRIMLPVNINNKKLELLYDSGCSAFGLITSKKRYDNFSEKTAKEINYVGKRWGDDLPIHHKSSNMLMKIGNENLSLNRVSYLDMYANFQHFLTPFTTIGGWLGNKPFLESTLILDTKKEEFTVLKTK
jgi:hypothetical protein